jgi:hypothetical protein
MMDLFDEIASEDAILLIYQADGETTVHRQSFNDRKLNSSGAPLTIPIQF